MLARVIYDGGNGASSTVVGTLASHSTCIYYL